MTTLYYWFGLDDYRPNVKDSECDVLPYHFSLNPFTKHRIICDDYVKKYQSKEKFTENQTILVVFSRKNPDKFIVVPYPLKDNEQEDSVLDIYPSKKYFCQVGTKISKFCTIVFD